MEPTSNPRCIHRNDNNLSSNKTIALIPTLVPYVARSLMPIAAINIWIVDPKRFHEIH
jgi:hypothetical protein